MPARASVARSSASSSVDVKSRLERGELGGNRLVAGLSKCDGNDAGCIDVSDQLRSSRNCSNAPAIRWSTRGSSKPPVGSSGRSSSPLSSSDLRWRSSSPEGETTLAGEGSDLDLRTLRQRFVGPHDAAFYSTTHAQT